MRRSRPNNSLQPGIALCALLSLAAPPAHAGEIYRWVDANGEVHYSNHPVDASRTAPAAPKPSEPRAPAPASSAPAAVRASRPVRLEEAVIRLEVDSEQPVGHVGKGPQCTPTQQFIAKPGRELLGPMDLPAHFAERVKKLGHQAGTPESESIRVFASVTKLKLKECNPSASAGAACS